MTFEEANKLAHKVFVGNPSNIYANNFTLEEYEALMKRSLEVNLRIPAIIVLVELVVNINSSLKT